jgi:hypothetical protein
MSEANELPPKRTMPGDRIALALSVAVVVLSALIVWRYPVYFRADDAYYLEWAAAHYSPLSAFNPAEAELFSTVRPLQNLAWWGLYRLCGLNPWPYQLVLTLLFGFSFVFFYRLVRVAFSRPVALFSLLAYGGVFYYLTYVVFWFSDLTFALEILLLNLSLLLLVRAASGKGRYFIFGILAWLGAVLAKEPSALIVPLVLAGYLLVQWRRGDLPRFRRSAFIAGAMLGAGLLWVMFNPYVHGRQTLAGAPGVESSFAYAAARWRFYAGYLGGRAGVLLWAATFYLALRRLLPLSRLGGLWKFCLPLVGGAALALVLRPAPAVALAVLLAAFVPLLLRRDPAVPGIVWFGVPLLGLMTVSFVVRTYLLEASFGAALIMGVALAEWGERLRWRRWALPPSVKAAAAALAAGATVLAAVFFAPRAAGKLGVLRVVSDTRQNFREVVEYLRENSDERSVNLVVVDYEDMGLSYDRDILPLADGPKAHRQKTMTGDELQRFLRVAGRENIRVRNCGWLRENPRAENVLVFIMNGSERKFLADTTFALQPVRFAERGSEGAWLMRPLPPVR